MLSTHYSPNDIESKWYKHWMENGYFRSTPDDREPFTIVIPPPNVTGVLHMGHMLNNTIQDILIRKARMEGKNACWVPGTDHASIATEAKVVKLLRTQGIKKSDLTRDEFLEHAFKWKEEYGGIILKQLQKLGASCDWDRTRFTMEESLSKAVIKVFVDLHKKGKLYRKLRMTNWDPVAKTVLSNEEVIHKEENSHLYHISYKIENDPELDIVIATQRPETIMADVAIAVHPDDERYKHLVGKNAIIPIINRPIPIIADPYVELEFGSGALKITPAHDQNDYEIGQKHGLPVIDILTETGHLNENAQILIGEDRFDARIKVKVLLKEAGALVELENYRTKIGYSERTDAVVEPRLTQQWYVNMKGFAADALKAVDDGEVVFYPDNMKNMYNSWLREENVRDWCISRQLWWGQRIPAWFLEGDDEPIVAETENEALDLAKERTGNANLTLADLTQEVDVVDTWFSSWLWPISVFDGFENQDELKYYYPTNVLVTGWDIMFFWVARMIMAGYEWSPELIGTEKGNWPFKDVFFTGMVRDNKRRKMSKSLGNSPEALKLIENYGADGVRYGILSCTSAGNDIIFDAPSDPETGKTLNESQLCAQGSKFCNKMWNALKLIKGWEVSDKGTDEISALAVSWFENRLEQAVADVNKNLDSYRLSDAILTLYKLIWNDFCSAYLEYIKPAKEQPISKPILDRTIQFFEKQMSLLHPFMPFITEEIWHQLSEKAEGNDCMMSSFPKANTFDANLVEKVEQAQILISKIRETRDANSLSSRDAYPLSVEKSDSSEALFAISGMKELVIKSANLTGIDFSNSETKGIGFVAGADKFYLEAEITIDVEAEKAKLNDELKRQKGFVFGISKKLSNERFVAGAPAAVVEREKQKLADGEARIRIIEESLAKLN